ncbi:MAG: hypothetical protein ACYDG2_00940 [Ruminiclostridium sp.]
MMTLFNQYKDSGKITETLLIGRNVLNKNPSDNKAFDMYFGFLCMFAESLPILSEKKAFAEQADILLALYAENAELSDVVISNIGLYKERLAKIFETISQCEAAQSHKAFEEISDANERHIRDLISMKNDLLKTNTQEQFDAVLTNIGKAELEINKDALTDKQKDIYDKLTKDFTESISAKMRELERIKNVEYNKQAVDSYAQAFKGFKNDEGKYKNHTQLYSLLSKTLFAYDAARMFNETLIYYNHVYSYIFSKLDDEGKLALTRFSIDCEKNRR